MIAAMKIGMAMSMVAVVMVMDHVYGDDYDGDKYECDDYNGGGTFGGQDMECLNTKTVFLFHQFCHQNSVQGFCPDNKSLPTFLSLIYYTSQLVECVMKFRNCVSHMR